MSSVYEYGYVQLNPDLNDVYDMEHEEEIYAPSNYPFNIPKVYLEGAGEEYYPQILFSWFDDSVVVVNEKILIKYTKHSYGELLAEDENGNVIWVDGRTAPYEGCWAGKYLGEHRGVLEYDIEEFHLDTLEKKKFKVSLESSAPMDVNDVGKLIDYIDPNIIKRVKLPDHSKSALDD